MTTRTPRPAPRSSPLRIHNIVATATLGGYFFDDQTAIKTNAIRDGANYTGTPATDGYRTVREPAEAVSVMLILDDGYIAHGDCTSVQYSGVNGREPRMQATTMADAIEAILAPALRGTDISTFRTTAVHAEALIAETAGLGQAAAYGLSQALLDAAAHAAGHHIMARVIQDEWQLTTPLTTIPIYGQTGEDRYTNVDKMILKNVDVLPHGLINTPNLIGPQARVLQDYIHWLKHRIQQLRTSPTYRPTLHLDVYGLLGDQTATTTELADIIQRLEKAATPYTLQLEQPLNAGTRTTQIEHMSNLRRLLRQRHSRVRLVADEWANTATDIKAFSTTSAADMVQIKTPDLGSLHNTIDTILHCHRHDIAPILGGSCVETERSARTSVHIAIATQVTQMLAKPGMGFDEGYATVNNEMRRALHLNRVIAKRSAT